MKTIEQVKEFIKKLLAQCQAAKIDKYSHDGIVDKAKGGIQFGEEILDYIDEKE